MTAGRPAAPAPQIPRRVGTLAHRGGAGRIGGQASPDPRVLQKSSGKTNKNLGVRFEWKKIV